MRIFVQTFVLFGVCISEERRKKVIPIEEVPVCLPKWRGLDKKLSSVCLARQMFVYWSKNANYMYSPLFLSVCMKSGLR